MRNRWIKYAEFFYVAALMLASPVASRAEDMSLGTLQAGVALAQVSLAASLNEFGSLQCVTNESREHLERFQAQSALVQSSFQKSYTDYVNTVTKPMAGNGKCDGGFHSVAEESEHRRKLTEQLEAKIFALQTHYANAMNADFVDATIDTHDESAGQQCSEKGSELYDAVEAAGLAANDAISKFRVGVAITGMRFASYTQKNAALSGGCGTVADMGGALGGISAAAPAAPGGKSVNPDSTITGRIQNSTLESGKAGASQNARAGEELAANQITGGSAGVKKEEAPNLQGFGSSLAGGGKALLKDSEEMQVQNLLKGQAGKGGEEKAGHVSAPSLEVLMEAHNSAELARGKADSGAEAQNGNASSTADAHSVEAGRGLASGEQASLAKGGTDLSLFDRMHRTLRKREGAL